MIAQKHFVEVLETDSGVAEVTPGTTWREALSRCVRPADHGISDDDIFAILNGGSDGATPAELCAAKGVTVPMYCAWKLKYRQLGLDQLRKARRREQRRRHSMLGLVILIGTLLTAAFGVGLGWAVSFTFKGVTARPSPTSTAASEQRHSPLSAPGEPRRVHEPVREPATAGAPSPADAVATIVETGYRIQVTAAETGQQGRAVVAQLASKGYPAYMTRAIVGDRDVFRVRVGPFETLSAAEEIATRLRSAGYDGVWIAR